MGVLTGTFSFTYINYGGFFKLEKYLPKQYLEKGPGKQNIHRNRIISPLFS